jgi:serine/threonine protein kinase
MEAAILVALPEANAMMRFCTECRTLSEEAAESCRRPGCRGIMRREALLGTVLDGRYRIESVLGLGGMGVLLRGRHERLASPVAIKVLHLEGMDVSAATDMVRRFRQEATLIAKLRHPAIVGVMDYGTGPDGRPYIVMEFLDGHDLLGELREHGTLPPARIAGLVGPIAEALEWTHAHGVVHRDIKPANVMLARIGGEEQVKVLDFGVAKLVVSASGAGSDRTMIVGTPEYMAPEQIDGDATNIGPATDVYALATMAYEMAAGETPFRATTFGQVVGRKMLLEFAPLAERRAEQGWDAADTVIRRALAVRPTERTPSVAAFARDLLAALACVEPARAAIAPAAPRDESSVQATVCSKPTPPRSGPARRVDAARTVAESSAPAAARRACPDCRTPLAGGGTFCAVCGAPAPAGEDRWIGRTVGDVCRIESRVPRGDATMVYRARNQRLGIPVELKLRPVTAGTSPAALERLGRDAAFGVRLRHAHLAATLDGGFDPAAAVVFVVSEWLDGPDLEQQALRSPAAPGEIRTRVLEVLDALAYLHDQGFVYRSLQPSNIVLARVGGEEILKLRDPASARGADEFSRTMTFGGARPPQFLAPEQLWPASPVDACADVYAAGALAYFLLCGRGPYDDESAPEAFARMRAGRLASPRALAPDRVSVSWERLILRAMAFRAGDRFATAAEMAAALSSAEG